MNGMIELPEGEITQERMLLIYPEEEDPPDYEEAPGTMSVARRRMDALKRALRNNGIQDEEPAGAGSWTTGWLLGQNNEDDRRKQWVYRNPHFSTARRLKNVSQVINMIARHIAAPPSQADREIERYKNYIRFIEDNLKCVAQMCEEYQGNWKMEGQRLAALKRKFGEVSLGSMSGDELDKVVAICRRKIVEAEDEIERRMKMIVEDSSCSICREVDAVPSRTCSTCNNGWCNQCNDSMIRCPFCRGPTTHTIKNRTG